MGVKGKDFSGGEFDLGEKPHRIPLLEDEENPRKCDEPSGQQTSRPFGRGCLNVGNSSNNSTVGNIRGNRELAHPTGVQNYCSNDDIDEDRLNSLPKETISVPENMRGNNSEAIYRGGIYSKLWRELSYGRNVGWCEMYCIITFYILLCGLGVRFFYRAEKLAFDPNCLTHQYDVNGLRKITHTDELSPSAMQPYVFSGLPEHAQNLQTNLRQSGATNGSENGGKNGNENGEKNGNENGGKNRNENGGKNGNGVKNEGFDYGGSDGMNFSAVKRYDTEDPYGASKTINSECFFTGRALHYRNMYVVDEKVWRISTLVLLGTTSFAIGLAPYMSPPACTAVQVVHSLLHLQLLSDVGRFALESYSATQDFFQNYGPSHYLAHLYTLKGGDANTADEGIRQNDRIANTKKSTQNEKPSPKNQYQKNENITSSAKKNPLNQHTPPQEYVENLIIQNRNKRKNENSNRRLLNDVTEQAHLIYEKYRASDLMIATFITYLVTFGSYFIFVHFSPSPKKT